jgi:hypothetical protein
MFIQNFVRNARLPIYIAIANVIMILIFTSIYYWYWKHDPIKYFEGLDESSSIGDVLYFTTTTQITIGYGDITPKETETRMIVTTHQILVATLALISLYLITRD